MTCTAVDVFVFQQNPEYRVSA